MSVTQDLAGSSADPGAVLARWLWRRETSLLLVLFAVLQQCLGHHNGDNSWLFTVCDKILDGARPYVDVIETNPPASFMIYLPSAALARLLGASVELVVSISVFAAALASIVFTGRILRAGGLLEPEQEGLAANAGIFALIVLPGFSFAEREHIAAIAILPPLAVYALRAAGVPVKPSHALVAGLLAGLTMAIKPHFALAIALALLAALARRRSLRAAFGIENFVAAGIVIAYGGLVVAVFPAFFEVLPAIMDTYVPVKEPLRVLLVHPWFIANCVMLAALAGFGRGRCLEPRVLMLIAASLGFLAGFVVQGKGWINHGLPGVALTGLAICLVAGPALAEIAARRVGPQWRELRLLVLFLMAPAAMGLPILFGSVEQFSRVEEYAGVPEAVRRLAPPRPKLIALSPELDMGHPLTRRVGGEWVGQPHSLWLMFCAQLLIDAKRGDPVRLATYVDKDAGIFAANVRDHAPDIILVSRRERVHLMQTHPAIADAMRGYERVETIGDIDIWTPTTRPSGRAAAS